LPPPSPLSATALLRPGLLDGVVLLSAGAAAPAAQFAPAVEAGCAALGARVATATVTFGVAATAATVDKAALDEAAAPAAAAAAATAGVDEAALDTAVAKALRNAGQLDLLALDGAGLFAAGLARTGESHTALRACLDGAWNATRAAVNGAFLPARGGRIVYLAPRPDAGEHAEAARAGLENLARTLSIEWARHGVTPVTIAPGADTPAEQVATLVAYLASPAGAYFSGCLLDLRGGAPV
jgi:NAD(P)-dependent dehydrogenase (short-subunit alcohol dehydrogenase family)